MVIMHAPEFPLLTTRRLRLRRPSPDDAPIFSELLSKSEVTRFTNWPDNPTPTQIARYLRWMSKLHASGKGCGWLIEDSRSGVVIGAIRFNRFDKKWKFGVVGYELHPDYWGRGLMTEALRVVVRSGHESFQLNRIEAWTLPGNSGSDRVLQKAGFAFEGTLRQRAWFKGRFHDFRMFGRLAGEAIGGK